MRGAARLSLTRLNNPACKKQYAQLWDVITGMF
jgi:hypothetical protein